TLDIGGVSSAGGGTVTLVADALTLSAGLTGNGGVQLRPVTAGNVIGIEDSTRTFNVTNAMLSNITSSGAITIGATTHSGAISAAGENAISQTKSLALMT